MATDQPELGDFVTPTQNTQVKEDEGRSLESNRHQQQSIFSPSRKKLVIIGSVVATLVVIAVVGTVAWHCTRRNEDEPLPGDSSFLNSTRQKYGYVDIRPNAHTFWWLFYSTHSAGYKNRPLVMWLQGGPGSSGTGSGLFENIGPFDKEGNKREFTWIQEVNVLFVDNPVGVGFSYVDSANDSTTNVDQIATDLTLFVKQFLNENPNFKDTPLYIFGQSYGGKMAAAASQKMQKEIETGDLECNLKGFAMGNSWIYPAVITMAYGPMLYWMSIVDEPGLERILNASQQVKDATDAGRWKDALKLYFHAYDLIINETNNIDFHNILQYDTTYFTNRKELGRTSRGAKVTFSGSTGSLNLEDFMNRQVRDHLGIIPRKVVWKEWASDVFDQHQLDSMKDVVGIVDDILNSTDLHVILYQGQLDLICNSVGAMTWVQGLTWDRLTDFNGATRKALMNPETKKTDSFVKAHEKFKFYWLLGSGHSAAADSKFAGLRMLKRIIDDVDR